MAMDSPDRVSSRMQSKYVTLEYCFILMSLYWIFSAFEFVISCCQTIVYVLYSPK